MLTRGLAGVDNVYTQVRTDQHVCLKRVAQHLCGMEWGDRARARMEAA